MFRQPFQIFCGFSPTINAAPLLEERERYLAHRASEGLAADTLRL